jgi:endonuclease/exonuclease/phosphatase family metal-dependent hydrolase
MKRLTLILALFAFLLFTLQPHTQATAPDLPNLCGSVPCIQVGTFNIEWFGTTDTSKHAHRSSLAVTQIADLIATTLDLEVVVLEEINSASQEYEQLKTALGAHGYKLSSGTSGGEQRVVIAYDDDEVDLIGDVTELPVRSDFQLSGNCSSFGLRRPLMAKFRAGGFDFIFIGVHLKSQINGDCADRVRKEQAKDLIAKVNEMANSSSEKDIIIAGDFNATSDDNSLTPLVASTGFRDLTKASRRANGSNSISYLKAPFQEIIDHILVRLDNTPEWLNKSTFIFNPPTNQTQLNKYLKHVSDHAPTWSSFKTNMTDDD